MKFVGATIGIIIGAIVLSALFALPLGWLFMLTIGVIHHEWISAVPTIGFWWAVVIAFTIRAIFTSGSVSSK